MMMRTRGGGFIMRLIKRRGGGLMFKRMIGVYFNENRIRREEQGKGEESLEGRKSKEKIMREILVNIFFTLFVLFISPSLLPHFLLAFLFCFQDAGLSVLTGIY